MPETDPDRRTVVAAFDVDGTLTTRDCVTPFLRRLGGRRLWLALARHPLTLAGALARRDRDRLKELAVTGLAGIASDDATRAGERFAQEIEASLLRPDTVGRLQAHLAAGHLVVLASASFEAYLEPLGRRLGAADVVCTRLEAGADGRLTGRLSGRNCRGEEKARRVRAWLDEHTPGKTVLWAYGDSPGDAPLLALADHPVWTQGVTIAPALPDED